MDSICRASRGVNRGSVIRLERVVDGGFEGRKDKAAKGYLSGVAWTLLMVRGSMVGNLSRF